MWAWRIRVHGWYGMTKNSKKRPLTIEAAIINRRGMIAAAIIGLLGLIAVALLMIRFGTQEDQPHKDSNIVTLENVETTQHPPPPPPIQEVRGSIASSDVPTPGASAIIDEARPPPPPRGDDKSFCDVLKRARAQAVKQVYDRATLTLFEEAAGLRPGYGGSGVEEEALKNAQVNGSGRTYYHAAIENYNQAYRDFCNKKSNGGS